MSYRSYTVNLYYRLTAEQRHGREFRKDAEAGLCEPGIQTGLRDGNEAVETLV